MKVWFQMRQRDCRAPKAAHIDNTITVARRKDVVGWSKGRNIVPKQEEEEEEEEEDIPVERSVGIYRCCCCSGR